MIIFINELYLINFVKIIELNRSSWFFLDNFYTRKIIKWNRTKTDSGGLVEYTKA